MGHIQVPQRSSLLPSEVCYPFCRKHGRRQAVIRHEFITLLGARTRSARGMRERASTNSISLRILLVVAAAALGYVVSAQAENYFCQQQFALCTSAPCIPEPGNPKVAICTCDVEDGPNLATVACDTSSLAPTPMAYAPCIPSSRSSNSRRAN